MRRINRRGQWQNYLLPAIMAVLVLGLSFYFIFNEYFTGEGMEREVCKQSIIVRGAIPDVKKIGAAISFKDEFPIKCKTNVVEVTEKDVKDGKVDGIIGDALAECWFIFGSGDLNVFPSRAYGDRTTCIPCARIHLTDKAKAAVDKGKIDIYGLLKGVNLFDMGGTKTSYLNYLNGVGKKFYPFNPMGTGEFNLSGDKFEIKGPSIGDKIDFPNFATKLDSDVDEWGVFGKVTLPRYLYVDKGDLIISVGAATTSEDVDDDYVPYLFYFQNGQDDYLKQMNKGFFGWDTKLTGNLLTFSKGICSSWEGIPA